MTVEQIIKACVEAKVFLSVEEDQLKIQFKGERLDPELLSALKANKQALLDYLRAAESNRVASKVAAIPLLTDRQWVSASYGQSRLWFIDKLSQDHSQYNMLGALRLRGTFDQRICRTALEQLVQRHEILRTGFVEQDGQPFQQIKATGNAFLNILDWQAQLDDQPEEEREQKVADFISAESNYEFDLSGDELFRTHLLLLSDTESVLVFNLHHIICDDWSVGILVQEFSQLYNQLHAGQQALLPDLSVQYADFSVWQKDWLNNGGAKTGIEFWQQYLADVPELHSLPLDFPRPEKMQHEGQVLTTQLGAKKRTALQKLAKDNDTTLFIVLQSIFAVLIARFGQQHDVVMGTPIAGRQHQDLEGLIGFFVNTLTLRSKVDPKTSFEEFLLQNKASIVSAYSHQQVPFEMLIEALNPSRSLSYSPVFQIMFSLLEDASLPAELQGIDISTMESDVHVAKFELQLTAINNEALALQWLYNKALFSEATIARFNQAFLLLVDGILAKPLSISERPLEQLPLLSESEQDELRQWGKGSINHAEALQLSTPDCLTHQAQSNPEQIAVTFNDQSQAFGEQRLSFAELNASANQLARRLKEQGIASGDLVALVLPRGLNAITAIYAVWKVGAAYIPIEPAYPQERIQYILQDSQAKLVLTESDFSTLVGDTPSFFMDQAAQAPQRSIDELNVAIEAHQLAYVIYTSGSTGQPKGVLVSHGNLNNLREGLHQVCTDNFGQEMRWAWNASYAFDASLQAISLLSKGVELYILSDEERKQPKQLLQTFKTQQINVYDCTSSQLESLFEFCSDEQSEWIPNLAVGGEAISVSLWRKIADICTKNDRVALNLYGPTECTVDSTYSVINAEEKPNIGRPMPNYRVRVVDSKGGLVPVGAVGELWIAGTGVSLGYLNRDELTAEKFVELQKIGSVSRYYKSGDLVRWKDSSGNNAGQLEYVGRTDNQIKLRGYRIELDEIQSQIQVLPEVKDNVVSVDKRHSNSNIDNLICYFSSVEVDKDWQPAEIEQLKSTLASKLPAFMIPALFIPVAEFSYTSNGKLDYKALPDPLEFISGQGVSYPPSTDTEKALAAIWSQLLNVEQPVLDDNFFALGGHSLLATRLVARIRDQIGTELTLQQLFEQPTIRGLAVLLEQHTFVSSSVDTIERLSSTKQARPEHIPLSFSQQKLWILEQLRDQQSAQEQALENDGSGVYNMVFGMKLQGELQLPALKQALKQIIQRHESLRTVIHSSEQGPYQVIKPAFEFVLEVERLKGSDAQQQIEQRLAEASSFHFDLAKDLPFKATLLQLVVDEKEGCGHGKNGQNKNKQIPNAHVAIFTMHHIASDGWSSGVFIRELNALYSGLIADKSINLPKQTMQYADYAIHQQKMFKEGEFDAALSYWLDALQDAPTVHGLPLDNARPTQQTFAGKHHFTATGQGLAKGIYDLAQQNNVSLFMLLESAFALLISRWSNSDDIVIGVPVANREMPGVENLIGFLVNTVALRTCLNEAQTFSQYLAANAQQMMTGLSHQKVPFELVVEKLNPERSNCHSPVFQIMFTLNNNEPVDLDLPGIDVEELPMENRIAKFELGLAANEISVDQDGRDIEFIWEYNTSLFGDEFIKRLSASFNELLKSIVAQPKTNILRLPLLPEAEKQRLLFEWNNTSSSLSVPLDGQSSLAGMFEQSAARHKDLPAVCLGEVSYSYAELNCRANQLARYLEQDDLQKADLEQTDLQQKGGSLQRLQQQMVGLCFGRGIDSLVAAIAVAKLGAAFVPIDPEFPAERISYILEDTGLSLVLVDSEGLAVLASQSIQTLDITDEKTLSMVQALSADNLNQSTLIQSISPQDLAYVIYTSGSTGQPKGVMVEQRNICNYLLAIKSLLAQASGGRYTSWTNYIFDYAVSEWFTPLLNGGCLHILKDDQRTDPDCFFNYLQDQKISVTYVPPFFLKSFRDWLQQSSRKMALKAMVVGLEPIDQALLAQIKSLVPGLRILNGYGPTEATIACTFFTVPEETNVSDVPSLAGTKTAGSKNTPIGKPITNVTHYVVNQAGELAPIGVAGELLIGGEGLARGYLNKPEETALAFIDHPFSESTGERVYKTGDWVKYLSQGDIEFVGRIDNQVKISGLRVELGEIEVQLVNCPLVANGAVVARAFSSNKGDKKIVAFVVPEEGIDVTNKAEFSEQLKTHLKQKLPDFMLPSVIQLLPALPMTATDKVDRKALMAMTLDIEQNQRSAPLVTNKVSQQLLAFWQEILGVEQIGLDDNFFEMGGTSLNVVMMANKIKGSIMPGIKAVDIFSHPTINSLAAFISIKSGASQKASDESSEDRLEDSSNGSLERKAPSHRSGEGNRDIAIIGVAGSFPKAENVEQFWENLKAGIEGISFFDREQMLEFGVSEQTLDNPNYIKAKGILNRSLEFDAALFDYKARDTELIDPQLRLLHECAWETLDNAGYNSDQYQGRIGMYGGATNNLLWLQHIFQQASHIGSDLYDIATLGDREFFMARVANKLNLTGPAVNVQTACSTSLVAVHMAIQGLLNGDCEMALAGGVSLSAQKEGYLYQEGMINSPDGHCRAFDAQAKGTVGGEGAGLVLLKRLEDAEADGDQILAVIKGSAINNDGIQKVGFTAPSVDGQRQVIKTALHAAQVEPDSISYVECHGTGTPLGDPIEVEALGQVFNSDKHSGVSLGAVKASIGHLDAAAGISGLIKTVLSLQHQYLPATLHFEQGNPNIDWASTPFEVVSKGKVWESDTVRRAGVSSFGIGGTNAHVVLEEYVEQRQSGASREWQILPYSAQTDSVLNQVSERLKNHLEQHSFDANELADVSYTLQTGRRHLGQRQVVLCQDVPEGVAVVGGEKPQQLLQGYVGDVPVVTFMFSGQGSQYLGMASGLYATESRFKETVDKCLERLPEALNVTLQELLFGESEDTEALKDTAITQPALFVVEYALAQLLRHWGIKADAMIGHSLGEYVAATLCGVLSLEDALKLVTTRGRLMGSAEAGSMLSVALSAEAVAAKLPDRLSLAADNSSDLCVVSGPTDLIDTFAESLAQEEIKHSKLHTSHAYHSEMMVPILDDFRDVVRSVQIKPPNQPYISNVTGDWITADDVQDVEYWCRHLRGTVQFNKGLETLLADSNRLFLEIGPGRSLCSLVQRHKARSPEHIVCNALRHVNDEFDDSYHNAWMLARLYVVGVDIDWSAYRKGEQRLRRTLPSYPFEHQTYAPGVDAMASMEIAESASGIRSSNGSQQRNKRPNLATVFVAPNTESEQKVTQLWCELFRLEQIGIHDDFFELGGNSLMATTLLAHLHELSEVELTIAEVFERRTIADLAELLDQQESEELELGTI